MSVAQVKADIVLIDKTGEEEIECKGIYYGTGRVVCRVNGNKLRVDPEDYHPDDPKRLWNCTTKKWTRFGIRSVILNKGYIRKHA